MTIASRIEQGAAMLDRRKPGWEKDLNLDTLEMVDCQFCVLGQLYGSYEGGKTALGLHEGTAHGFNSDTEQFSILTRAWRRFVAKRLFQTFKKYLGKVK